MPQTVFRPPQLPAMDAAAPAYVPVDGAPWRWSMGLHRLELDRWLEVDDHRAAELSKKISLLATARDTVFVALAGSEPACEELRALVVDHLDRVHPELLVRDGDGFVEPTTGTRLPSRLHPLEVAALLVQEDLCVLEHREGAWLLSAACVCFPSRWSLREKLGATLAEIHGPVPGFDYALGAGTVRFFDRLTADRPAWRCNWTLLETDELHLPSPAGRRPGASDVTLAATYFRVERQTLRRLAETGAVVFTIRTYVTPLAELLDTHPGLSSALVATLRTVPDEVAAYKGWSGGRLPALLAALEGRGGHE